MTVSASPAPDLLDPAEHVLASWTATAASSTTAPDLGPVVLATLLPESTTAGEAIRTWLRTGVRCRAEPGLYGGRGGILAGLRLVASCDPAAVTAASRAAEMVAGDPLRRRAAAVGFDDYDVIAGPAGTVLAQLAGTLPARSTALAPAATHLADLARTGLRIGAYDGHPLVGWAQGGVVTGLAHGVAGPLAALAMAAPHLPQDSGITTVLQRLGSWLADQRFTDARQVVSWPQRVPAADGGGAARRQGWCYGTPGVAWALWAAGTAVDRADHPGGAALAAVAVDAMRSLCAGWDPASHLDHDPFSVCHGAAGVLLVADAFARHAGLAEAATLRAELTRYLVRRLDEITHLDPTLLTGAPGVLAALLTAAGGDRGWLPCLALY